MAIWLLVQKAQDSILRPPPFKISFVGHGVLGSDRHQAAFLKFKVATVGTGGATAWFKGVVKWSTLSTDMFPTGCPLKIPCS